MREESEAPEGEDGPEELLQIAEQNLALNVAMARLPQDDADAQALLKAQAHVLHLQAEHLHEQREVQLSHLKARRISEWMKVGLQGLTGLVGLFIAAIVLALVIGAARSRDVVVEAFETPPALAARGVTGKVVASGMLDALNHLQAATRATAAKRNLASAWRGDIKVEVPETGVSIGELRLLMRDLLGHDLHIDGDLTMASSGALTLTVRGDTFPSRSFTGGAEELDGLTTRAAEYAYGAIDPYLLATYLSNAGRTAETLVFLAAAFPDAAEAERPDLLNQWGNAFSGSGRLGQAAVKYRAALALRPDFWKAWGNLVLALGSAGREEAAFAEGTAMARAKARRGDVDASPTSRDAFDMLVQDWTRDFADLTWDMRTHGRSGTSSTAAPADLAWVEAERHDWPTALAHLDEADVDDPSTIITRGRIAARRAMEAGDPAGAAAALAPVVARVDADPSLRGVFPTLSCDLGLAYALSGRRNEGMRLLDAGARRTACRAAKGDALAAGGDWPGALAAYRAAITLAPDLPLPYQKLGLALLRRDDRVGAAAMFARAHERGPHWADPRKGLGDTLARQGRWSAARDAYDAALADAPHWVTLGAARAVAKTRAEIGA